MIITNSIIKTFLKFDSKEQIKKFLYDHVENHPFRKYNNLIAKKYGDHYFSMTFIAPNIVVLTQKYETWNEYYAMLKLREDVVQILSPFVQYYKISEPFEVYYETSN